MKLLLNASLDKDTNSYNVNQYRSYTTLNVILLYKTKKFGKFCNTKVNIAINFRLCFLYIVSLKYHKYTYIVTYQSQNKLIKCNPPWPAKNLIKYINNHRNLLSIKVYHIYNNFWCTKQTPAYIKMYYITRFLRYIQFEFYYNFILKIDLLIVKYTSLISEYCLIVLPRA